MQKYEAEEMRRLMETADSERRDQEFKVAFSWNDKKALWLKECVIRAALGLTNTPSGGRIIIGIEEDEAKRPVINGVSKEQRQSFEAIETIKDEIDSFSSVPISFDIGWGEYEQNGLASLVIISVSEFDEMPAICRRNGKTDKLRQGDVYSRKKKGAAATVRVTEDEMREIIRMATDKEFAIIRRRGYLGDAENQPLNLVERDKGKFQSQTEDWDKI